MCARVLSQLKLYSLVLPRYKLHVMKTRQRKRQRVPHTKLPLPCQATLPAHLHVKVWRTLQAREATPSLCAESDLGAQCSETWIPQEKWVSSPCVCPGNQAECNSHVPGEGGGGGHSASPEAPHGDALSPWLKVLLPAFS